MTKLLKARLLIISLCIVYIMECLFIYFYPINELKNEPSKLYHISVYSGNPIHQCSLPVLYVVDKKFPPCYIEKIIDGVEFWNKTAGTQIFKYMGEVDTNYVYNNMLVIYYKNVNLDNVNYLGQTNFELVYDDCIISSSIYIYAGMMNSEQTLINVVRHESGHVLGFNHNIVNNSLMSVGLDTEKNQIINLSDVEYKALKLIY